MQGNLCAADVIEHLKLDTGTKEINNNLNSLFTVVHGTKS